MIRILVQMTLLVGLAILSGGCAYLVESRIPEQLQEALALMQASGDRGTYLLRRPSLFRHHMIVGTRIVGEDQFDPDQLDSAGHWMDDEHGIRWSIRAPSDSPETLKAIQHSIEPYLHESATYLSERGLPGGLQPHIHIYFAPPGADVDFQAATRFHRRPELKFVYALKGENQDELHESIATALAIVHHELVHVATHTGVLTIPGSDRETRATNEETFAYLVELCDQHRMGRVHSASHQTFTFEGIETFKDAGNAGACIERGELLDCELDHRMEMGPTFVGRLMAEALLYQHTPLGKEQDAIGIESLTEHCAELSQSPHDYFEIHLREGPPEEWYELLTPTH